VKRATGMFWLIVAFGLCVPPVVAIGTEVVKGTPLASASGQWIEHLFQPGFNEFLLTLFTATPFIVLAVFSIFHLTSENASKRLAGVSGALAVGAGLMIWGLVAIRMSHGSTAAIGFVFLPFEVAIVMPVGYLAGRLFGRLVT
jgi:hypothetical protein